MPGELDGDAFVVEGVRRPGQGFHRMQLDDLSRLGHDEMRPDILELHWLTAAVVGGLMQHDGVDLRREPRLLPVDLAGDPGHVDDLVLNPHRARHTQASLTGSSRSLSLERVDAIVPVPGGTACDGVGADIRCAGRPRRRAIVAASDRSRKKPGRPDVPRTIVIPVRARTILSFGSTNAGGPP
jgi:hypothetical protein